MCLKIHELKFNLSVKALGGDFWELGHGGGALIHGVSALKEIPMNSYSFSST